MREIPQHTPTLRSYILGFALSIFLTLLAFGLTYIHTSSDHQSLSHSLLINTIIVLSILQLVVQTVFLLHLSRRKEQRFNVMAFIFTLYTVAFIVIGSLWILHNLDYNMSPEAAAKYLHNEN